MSNRKPLAKTLSLYQLIEQYPDNNSAVRYFEKLRWRDNPICAKCGGCNKITAQKKAGTYWCGDCRGYFTVFTNTPMERSKIDARKWIYVAYTLLTSRKGISSLQLSKEIGVQQKTAWYMLHRLRLACGADMEALSGVVEVDETYIGGKEKNKHSHKKLRQGRGAVGKQAVIGARERDGKVQAKVIGITDAATLKGFIQETVEVGSTVYTDEHRGYNDLGGLFYQHDTVKHSAREYVNGMAHTNGIESVWALLKRGYNGTYHNWSSKHCQRYVNEFMFRLNEGNCQIDTQDRLDNLFCNMSGKVITYKELTA